MADFPYPADLFAFAVIFFPGFISLCIILRFHCIALEKLGTVEKVVVSFVLSVGSFLLARIPINPLAPSLTVLSFENLALTFVAAVALGLMGAMLYYGWLYVEAVIIIAADWIRSIFGWTIVPGTALKRALDVFWKSRYDSYVVVTDRDGRTFRGFLGLCSLDPALQVVLSRYRGRNPEKLEQGEWKPAEEWALVFTEENIRWIGSRLT